MSSLLPSVQPRQAHGRVPIKAVKSLIWRLLTWQRLLIVALLVIHGGLLAWSGYRNSPGLDEVAHLPAGISHWELGRFELYRVNPPLVRMIAAIPLLFTDVKTTWDEFSENPLLRPEFSIGRQFFRNNGEIAFWYFTLARWACIPLSLLGGYVCFRWARELYGVEAGFVALTLWCFSPNILANAAMITPDAGAASLGILAGYCFWHWLKSPDWLKATGAGLALGAAELTKTTWIVLYGLWPLLWMIWRTSSSDAPTSRMQQGAGNDPIPDKAPIQQLLYILFLSVYVLNLAYGFEGSFRALNKYQFISRSLGGAEAHETPGNRFASWSIGRFPVPLPQNYVLGIDVQRHDFERKKWSYLRGEWKFGGWWYWYLYALAVKVPVGTMLLTILAAVVAICWRPLWLKWQDELVLIAPAAVVLVLVSSQTGFSRYLRYLLPMVPFCFVWISQAVRCVSRKRWGLAVLGGVALSWSVISSLVVHPHSLSYFNELAGGPLGGPAHLLDANIDWGQDLLNLKRWYAAHGEVRPLYLQYFGLIDPKDAGIVFKPIPKKPQQEGEPRVPWTHKLRPGWYAISVNDLYGYDRNGGHESYFAYLRDLKPVAMAGYSIYIYDLTSADIDRIATPNRMR